MTVDVSMGTVFQGIATILLGIIGWMLRGVYIDFKKAMEKISEHEIRLAVLEEKVERLEGAERN